MTVSVNLSEGELMSQETELQELRRAGARLRKELWLVVGDAAWRVRWHWFAHGAYRKAVEAARDERERSREKEPAQ